MWSPPAGRPRGAAVGGLLRSAWPRARVVVAGQRRQAARAFVDSRLTSPPPRTTTRARRGMRVRACTDPSTRPPPPTTRCAMRRRRYILTDPRPRAALRLLTRTLPVGTARQGKLHCARVGGWGDECDGRPQPTELRMHGALQCEGGRS